MQFQHRWNHSSAQGFKCQCLQKQTNKAEHTSMQNRNSVWHYGAGPTGNSMPLKQLADTQPSASYNCFSEICQQG
jgi:hypothetical protein